ncbi:MAG TPA: hypothetical protein DCE41_22370 [Cytophagales bacterium]|nr:hypothetical protein [Cytophagales bacterium]HAA21922.1 hypothetical protein [Cytophagales bacterium]
MKRKTFLRKALLGTAGAAAAPAVIGAGKSTYDKLREPIGYNHLPNKEEKTMKTVLHRAASRGHANHGWLDSHHTFSFANYYNPERVHFGALRVLNDDIVTGGKGFGTHPHDNMEIISIPMSGALEHKDSMGNSQTIATGDVQVMSAGTGIYHSEFNKSKRDEVRFLQIWMFPNRKNVTPRYDQITLDPADTNTLQQVLSPNQDDAGVWAHQDAWFHMGRLEAGFSTEYKIHKPGNGVYAFVMEGSVKIGDQELAKRDGFGIWNTDAFQVEASQNAQVLLMEVPMEI